MAQATNYNKYKKYTKENKYKSKPLKNRASMLAMRTSTNIKKTKRTQMIPLHTRDEICPSFAHARLAASVFVMAEASAKALSLAAYSCFIFLVWSKLIVNNISPFVFSLWPGCPVLWWRVPLKNEVLPPDTMSFDGSSKDNWCYAWGSWGFPGDVWIWDLGWVRAGVLIL